MRYFTLIYLSLVSLLLLTACQQTPEPISPPANPTDPLATSTQPPATNDQPPTTISEAYPPPGTPTRLLGPSGYPVGPLPTSEPFMTYTPGPTRTPTAIPSPTPIPSPLSLPPSAYHLVWAEPHNPDFTTGEDKVWLADPRDIASKQELFQFPGRIAQDPLLSPDGNHLLIATDLFAEHEVWLYTFDTQTLTPLPIDSYWFQWHPNSTTIAFVNLGDQYEYLSGYNNQDEPFYAALETYDIVTQTNNQLIISDNTEESPGLSLVGWAEGGEGIYYRSDGYIWHFNLTTYEQTQVLVKTERPFDLSPNGSLFLFPYFEGLRMAYLYPSTAQPILDSTTLIDQLTPQTLITSHLFDFSYIWEPTQSNVVYGHHQWDETTEIASYPLFVHDFATQTTEKLGTLIPEQGWNRIEFYSISPDYQWALLHMNYSDYSSYSLWHIETNMVTTIYPPRAHGVRVVGWLPAQ